MTPTKRIVSIADHRKRFVPLIVVRNISVQAHEQSEKAFVEEHAVGRDWIRLVAVGFNPIGCPPWHIVFAPMG
jgi:hypothetical protein